jgi:zinc/manganese transport system substrate-binding protein
MGHVVGNPLTPTLSPNGETEPTESASALRLVVTRRQALAAAAGALISARAQAEDRIKVVASFSILGDFVRNVGGERLEVATLVGPNGNAHVYAPSPADAKTVADARLVVVNGMGFEGWLERLVKASGTKAPIIVATKGITPRTRAGDHEHGRADPHAWQSVANARIYVANVRDALVAADPAGKVAYEANAAGYLGKLDALEREVRDTIARIPPDRRRVLTSHNAFGYFADAYGVAFVAPQGVSTEAEASAKDVAAIITQIKRQKIGGVFLENVTDPRLVTQIAGETGAKVGGTLYSDALTPAAGDAPTYVDLIRHNLRQLAAALAG